MHAHTISNGETKRDTAIAQKKIKKGIKASIDVNDAFSTKIPNEQNKERDDSKHTTTTKKPHRVFTHAENIYIYIYFGEIDLYVWNECAALQFTQTIGKAHHVVRK